MYPSQTPYAKEYFQKSYCLPPPSDPFFQVQSADAHGLNSGKGITASVAGWPSQLRWRGAVPWRHFDVTMKFLDGVNFLVSDLGSWYFSWINGGVLLCCVLDFPTQQVRASNSYYLPQQQTESIGVNILWLELFSAMLAISSTPCFPPFGSPVKHHGDVPVAFSAGFRAAGSEPPLHKQLLSFCANHFFFVITPPSLHLWLGRPAASYCLAERCYVVKKQRVEDIYWFELIATVNFTCNCARILTHDSRYVSCMHRYLYLYCRPYCLSHCFHL